MFRFTKTPDGNNAFDFATVSIEVPDGLTKTELFDVFADFMRAVGYTVGSLTEEDESIVHEDVAGNF